MKKMIFTAMAVLAFSAVSVANTIEVKEEVVVNNESKEVIGTPCEDSAINSYEEFINAFHDGEDDLDLLNDLLSVCH
ncbi:hypothetical protein [Flavobacterium sp. 9R]|uniref:hypothetical protein n=1 Tax=Flavobacterium sp. 9R TaxID=2653143 RepID=UPI00135BF989|nr:hypothetical protein [Flavobacterium sp. 9R]